MRTQAKLSCAPDILTFRELYREEMDCQIVHDSIHRRTGWTLTYVLELEAIPVGFGSVAIGGPWKNKPTLFEFYVLPKYRTCSFDLFEALLSASGAQFMEIQSNEPLPFVMLHTYARDIASEKIVFHDKAGTALPANGAMLRRITSEEETRACIEQRQGGPEWVVELEGNVCRARGNSISLQSALLRYLHGSGQWISPAWTRFIFRAGIEARGLRSRLCSLRALQPHEHRVAPYAAKSWIRSLRAHAHRYHPRRELVSRAMWPRAMWHRYTEAVPAKRIYR